MIFIAMTIGILGKRTPIACDSELLGARPYAYCSDMEYAEYHNVMDYAEGIEPPHYPVPATYLDCMVNHNQWRIQQWLNNQQ